MATGLATSVPGAHFRPKTHFGVFGAQGMSLMAANVLLLFNKS